MIDILDTQAIIGSPHFGYAHCAYALQTQCPHRPADERATLAAACVTIGCLANIGDLFLVAWILKETAGLRSERWTKSLNPAGLGATNDGAWGSHFDTIAEGVAAMAGHALLYATRPELLSPPQLALVSLDPRREPLRKAHGFGVAPRFIDLSQKWGVLPKGIVPPPITHHTAYGMSIVVRTRALAGMLPPGAVQK